MEALTEKIDRIPRNPPPEPAKELDAKRKRPPCASPALRPICCFHIILVELIVVLVILAILAAMLVPALLGWIDEARNKQYVLEARNIYVAAQAVADEAYAKSTSGTLALTDLSKDSYKRIVELADLKSAPTISEVTVKGDGTANRKDAYSIIGMAVSFTADNNTPVAARLLNGKWEVATAAVGGTAEMPKAGDSDYPAGSTTLGKAAAPGA